MSERDEIERAAARGNKEARAILAEREKHMSKQTVQTSFGCLFKTETGSRCGATPCLTRSRCRDHAGPGSTRLSDLEVEHLEGHHAGWRDAKLGPRDGPHVCTQCHPAHGVPQDGAQLEDDDSSEEQSSASQGTPGDGAGRLALVLDVARVLLALAEAGKSPVPASLLYLALDSDMGRWERAKAFLEGGRLIHFPWNHLVLLTQAGEKQAAKLRDTLSDLD